MVSSYIVLKILKSLIILTINEVFPFIQVNMEVKEESSGDAHVYWVDFLAWK